MNRIWKFWKVFILDVLGVLFMIAAILTGWLPGPGGVPLFIIGLSLLAINHEWAKRYIDLLRKYVDKLGDLVFKNDPKVQLFYDVLTPIILAGAFYLLIKHISVFMVSLGIFWLFIGLTVFFGNRNRWQKLKKRFKRKQ